MTERTGGHVAPVRGAERVELAAGAGLLIRRHDGVLFCGDAGAPTTKELTAAFTAAPDAGSALDAVLTVAADAHLATGPFAIVTWSVGVHVVVFGDLTLHTDLPSLPHLAGAAMATWVEHRTPRPPDRCALWLGAPAIEGTDLVAGVAPVGGFRVTLAVGAGIADGDGDGHHSAATPPAPSLTTAPAPVPAPPPAAPTPAATTPAATTAAATTRAATTPPAPTPAAPTTTPRAAAPAAAGRQPAASSPTQAVAPPASWEVLRDAGGGWMEESLRISGGRGAGEEPPSTEPHADRGVPHTDGPGAADPPAEPPSGSAASNLATFDAAAFDPATFDPTTFDPAVFDPEVTLDPATAVPPGRPAARPPDLPPPLARVVQARRCDDGHLNPPLRTECRTCGHYIPPATTVENVPQPTLATLLVPDGRAIAVAGAIVVGRRPDAEAARLDEPGQMITIDGDPSVSRTHLVVAVDGWTVLATDCATTAGTAMAPAGAEPILLEPWVPHEIVTGTTLFLGGRTQLRVVAAP